MPRSCLALRRPIVSHRWHARHPGHSRVAILGHWHGRHAWNYDGEPQRKHGSEYALRPRAAHVPNIHKSKVSATGPKRATLDHSPGRAAIRSTTYPAFQASQFDRQLRHQDQSYSRLLTATPGHRRFCRGADRTAAKYVAATAGARIRCVVNRRGCWALIAWRARPARPKEWPPYRIASDQVRQCEHLRRSTGSPELGSQRQVLSRPFRTIRALRWILPRPPVTKKSTGEISAISTQKIKKCRTSTSSRIAS